MGKTVRQYCAWLFLFWSDVLMIFKVQGHLYWIDQYVQYIGTLVTCVPIIQLGLTRMYKTVGTHKQLVSTESN